MIKSDNRVSRKAPLSFLARYGLALASTALAALARWMLPWALAPAPYLGFYPAVVVSAALGGVGPGLVATFTSLFLVNFVFGHFNAHDQGAMMRQVIWVVASIGVSLLAGLQRAARTREHQQAGELHRLNDELELRVEERTKELIEADKALKEANEALELQVAERTAELQAANTTLLDSSRAALNMMEDAVIARRHAEETSLELHREVTERKQAEVALRESELFYRQTLDSIPGMVFTTRPDGYCDFQSQPWVDFTGVPMSEHLGDGWNKLLHPDDRPRAYAAWRAAVEERAPYDLEYRVRRHDGAYEWFKVSGRPISNAAGEITRWFGTALNIDTLVNAQEALIQSKERFRSLFNGMTEGFALHEIICDAQGEPCDYRFLDINPAFERLTGLQRVDVVGRLLSDVLPDDDPYWVRVYGKVALTGESIQFDNYSPALSRHFEIFAYSPAPRQFAVIFVDITARKKAEEELQKAHAELEERVVERTIELASAMNTLNEETAERIRAVEELREKEQLLMQQGRQAAMGEMIGNIAHQWRQPLNMLGLIVQELPIQHKLGDLSTEFLDNSVTNAIKIISHMSQTIDDFRNFFQPDKTKVSFKVNDIMAKTLTLIDGSFKEQRISIEISAQDDVYIHGYPNEFSQVLLNILLNARDAFVERGIHESRSVLIKLFREEDKTVVTIADNAGGIPEEIMEKIFDPYFTTKGPDKGTGVGLFMSKTIIERNMSGTLSACNSGGGAEFRIEV